MMGSITVRRVLAASAIAEAATGIVLAVAPALVTSLLFGVDASLHWTPFARVAGVALLALGLACWPGADTVRERTPAACAMCANDRPTYVGTRWQDGRAAQCRQ
jgi:hypothetical protein